ncbi:MAG: NADH:flavin oxidoreductase/NADH oxidase [Dysgonomonas sp.]|nr:NADH:flavin oxidoreductase/NADH oxidase [Dysgonomonas sp.]
MSILFSPLQIKNIVLKNRVVMSPMCQYSAINGYVNEWHFVHYATRVVGGCAAIIQEATAVLPEGRITYGDLGIWEDEQIANMKRITSFMENRGTVPGIQLAHAGRKASCELPWNGGDQLKDGTNSWQTVSASAIPFHDEDKIPQDLSEEGLLDIIKAFKDATQRAVEAGYRIIEIHAAHGYLIHQFLSPLTNKRSDLYGGTFTNRIRLLLEIVDVVAKSINETCSLWVRISATDWIEGGWDIEQSVQLTRILKEKGVDVIDVSSGGNLPSVKIPVSPGYQVPLAEKIKHEGGIMTGAVGLITKASQAETILKDEQSDIILLGRELLRNPYFPISAVNELDGQNISPLQYERAF